MAKRKRKKRRAQPAGKISSRPRSDPAEHAPGLHEASLAWLQGYAEGLFALGLQMQRQRAQAAALRREPPPPIPPSPASPVTDEEIEAYLNERRRERDEPAHEVVPPPRRRGAPRKYSAYWDTVVRDFDSLIRPQYPEGTKDEAILRDLLVIQLGDERSLDPAKARALIESPRSEGVKLRGMLKTLRNRALEERRKRRST